jgi:LuxR family maltose regulon positive regulatory protein
LTEVHAGDLRFALTEAGEFLQAMSLDLAADEVAALEARTEGWITGLQLAALSLRSHPDKPGFIRAFAGDHRYIADYLVEEVLQRQPEPVRRFLLQTAILDRLTGALCEAVTGSQEARAGWRPWSRATSLSFRSMTNATGIAITISLPTCSMRT